MSVDAVEEIGGAVAARGRGRKERVYSGLLREVCEMGQLEPARRA